MKKVLVLGAGAQGSAAAKRLDIDPGVKEIICADYDLAAVEDGYYYMNFEPKCFFDC